MSIYVRCKGPFETENCSICWDPLKGEHPVVAHEGDGYKHPNHEKCITEWLKQALTCPICKEKIDGDNMLPWKDRVAKVIRSDKDLFIAQVAFSGIWAASSIASWSFGNLLGSFSVAYMSTIRIITILRNPSQLVGTENKLELAAQIVFATMGLKSFFSPISDLMNAGFPLVAIAVAPFVVGDDAGVH